MSGYLIFGGIDSRDYDVFVSFSDIDTVPRRVYTKVDIVGKNGSVLIDEGKYEDVPHSYDCIVLDNEKRVAFVNAIMSKKGYQRLTDSYGTDEYYTAVLEENIEQNTTRIRDKYKFKLIFTRKPQRFLTSGEEPVDTSELGGEVTTDKIPYLFRRSGGGNIGHDFDAEIDKIIGGTVAWNQLAYNNRSATLVRSTQRTINVSTNYASSVENHIYLVTVRITNTTCVGGLGFQYGGTNWFNSGTGQKHLIYKANNNLLYYCYTYISLDESSDATLSFEDFSIIDLTQAFGTEIADYVYSLEHTTEGSGIAWLKSHGFLTKDYYAYNKGSLLSVKTSEHRTVGFNQWDEEWEVGSLDNNTGANFASNANIRSKNYIPIIPNTTYREQIGNNTWMSIFFYDKDYNFIPPSIGKLNQTFDTPSNAHYMRFRTETNQYPTTYNHDICINISKTTGSPKNGDYVAYDGHSYPLDSDLELRGIPKLSNGSLYYDGDVYESSGAVTREYGIRAYQSGDESLADAITDGTNTVYKLTTPTTEQADPYANPQIVNSLGTEEYIDARDVPVPVGHETKYGMSQLILSNPTEFPSKPLLEVTGVGTFWLGDTLFTIMGTAGQTIYIDCETGEAWKNTGGIITPANGLVTLNRLDFPELDPGDTPVMYGTGITKVVVTPRWWRL